MNELIRSRKYFLLVVLFGSGICRLSAQSTISGIINSYASVSNIVGSTDLTVSTTTGFAVGEKILIIQMKGADVTTTNSAAYGDITLYNNSGNFEFAYIASIAGTTITLTAPLVKSYTVNDLVQIVDVPFYCSVDVVDTLTCQAWDGTTGGVLVFESGGTVTLNAPISVTGKGFKAQATCGTGTLLCNAPNYYYNPTGCQAGWKGEGIADWVNNPQSGGRAKLANGGGGGSRANNGGGGGSNYGAGGLSGFEDNSCIASTVQASGGVALDYALGKIFMGGSGGNGQGNDDDPMAAGGSGGGLAIVSAVSFNPNGFPILAEGADVTALTINEGAGGGGGGGAVLLDITSLLGPLNVSTSGGDGGSTDNDPAITDCTGTGGGGGGGVLWTAGAALNPLITYTSVGGQPGLALEPASTCFNTSFGATAGADGGVIFNYPPHILPQPPIQPDLGPDTFACALQPLVLYPGAGFSNFVWQDGSTDSVFTAVGPGTYWVTITDSTGCSSSDTIDVFLAGSYNFTIGFGDTTVCQNQLVTIDAGPNHTSYLWQDGTTTQTYTTNDTGTYSVTIVDSFACVGTASYEVFNFVPFSFTIGTGDTTVCFGEPVTIDPGSQYDLYLWQDLSTSQTYTTTNAGFYYVNVQDTLGCVGYSSYNVFNFPGDIVDLGNDTALCVGDSVVLDAGIFPQYLWSDGSMNKEITVFGPGVYFCTVVDFNGCIIADTVEIVGYYPSPPANLINDTLICIPDTLLLLGPPGYATYEWSDGSDVNFIEITQPGGYSLTVTTSNTCAGKDSFQVYLQCETALFVPTAFTPNGDGINDVFIPVGYNITSFFMQIFNRWGEEIFESSSIDKAWDGRCSGVPCEIGTYVYRIVWSGELEGVGSSGTEVGNVTLIR